MSWCTRPRRTVLGVLLALGLLGTACGGSTPARSETPAGRLTVSAAASLTGAFGAVERAFESAHPSVDVTLTTGASSSLVAQIVEGAPVDVIATADEVNMAKVSAAGLLSGRPIVFATNSLQIIVAKGNPLAITGLTDLATPGLVLVTCSPEVPIGRYTAEVLQKADVKVSPRSLEPDVKGIVAKVLAGEADAGIVYATDVAATNGATTGVTIPESDNVIARYPVATLAASSNPVTTRAWIDFLLAPEGRTILREFGFGAA